ncbi:hypothetical protein D7Z54_01700 [Salibacterium salarium]|uniref:Uncharacterized protein n=1 Tax=Salibacterium salarium TaxID=284579 RepID=A0A428NAA5_9BACI|nr:hypothetical protein [Salibacterium salarium]RSL35305.1 hypothetical protein D7Z54_01700 [Salibacterium salarium]
MAKNEQKQRMTFDYAGEIEEQRKDEMAKRDKVNKREQEAKAKVAKLKRDHEEALLEGVKNGDDNTDELDRLSQEIERAEQIAARRASEAAATRKVFDSKVDKETVKQEFRAYKKSYYQNEVLPHLEEIRQIKRQLVEAYLEYEEAIRFYEDQKSRASSLIPDTAFDVFGSVKPQTKKELDKYLVTFETVQDLQQGNIPKGVDTANDDEEAK